MARKAKKDLMRIEQSIAAASAAFGCAQLLDAGLEQQLGPAADGEEGLGSAGRLAVRAGRRLVMLRRSYEAATDALDRVQDELRRFRRRRGRAFRKLYEVAKDLRKICRGHYGKDQGDEFLGLHGDLPREPKELHLAFAPVVGRLADAEWPLPQPGYKGIKVDREKVVTQMIKLHGALGSALDEVGNGEMRETVAKAAKKRTKMAFEDFLGKSGRFLEAALDLAGLEELVATVRPGVGRKGRPSQAQLGAPGPRPELPAGAEPKALVSDAESDDSEDL